MSSCPPTSPGSRTLLESLLDEQRNLTAVEAFSRAHEAHAVLTPHYRALLPAAPPRPGQQYAFEVNLDQCSGCKACVTACHALNGLDDTETWRNVGQLLSADWRRPFQQTVTTACHHCVDPGCLNGCPVLAYEKDASTGIVRHLDDQCIGCQYCVMTCPYEVPQYSKARGIVRKCDLCSQRLAVGEAPACVQACPSEAIRITMVEQDTLRTEFRSEAGEGRTDSALEAGPKPWLPSAPDPAITLPTTRFISSKPLPADLLPGDAAQVRLQPAHWPLVFMLTLTQLSVGGFATSLLAPGLTRNWCLVAALAAGWAGLAASALHLGKPLKAWRSFLGLRRSWLSREIVVFGVFAPLAGLTVGLAWLDAPTIWTFALQTSTVVTGFVGVVCSAMIYHDTRRVFWRGPRTLARFLLSAVLLGMGLSWVLGAMDQPAWPPLGLAFVAGLKLTLELRALGHGDLPLADEPWPNPAQFDAWSLARSGRLLGNELGLVTRWRMLGGLLGGVILPLMSLLPGITSWALPFVGFLLCLLGELAERYTFFRAVVPPRMPGGAG